MKFSPSFLVSAAVLLFASLLNRAAADSILSGNIVGVFEDSGAAHTSVINSPNGSASFRSGVATAGSFQSGISFTGNSFSDAGSGEVISAGLFTYYNGITQLGTTSANAVFDLYLQAADPLASWVHLATLNFGIDATANTGSNLVPDQFSVTYAQPDPFLLGNEWFQLSIGGIPETTSVAENSWTKVGSLTLTMVPTTSVADEGTSVLLFALGLAALACYRGKSSPSAGLSA